MLKEIELSYSDKNEMLSVIKALANESRINILQLLDRGCLNVNEIAETLDLPVSTTALNIKILEEAGLVLTELQPGIRGSMKVSSKACSNIIINLNDSINTLSENCVYINMPIGNYSDCLISPSCGLVSEKGSIGRFDKPSSFYYPEKVNAQLLWFYKGYIEYKFPYEKLKNKNINMLEISTEICSEAPHYKNDWPSDITMWINDIEVGTWTSPGDFGGRRGRNNPQWWPDTINQYGLLKYWRIKDTGTYIDDVKLSDKRIGDFKITDNDFISVKIGIKENAKNIGGISIFGKSFGDYPQDIIMKIEYEKR